MTGKIEWEVGAHHTMLRLIGHPQAAHLEALRAQLGGQQPQDGVGPGPGDANPRGYANRTRSASSTP
jgi:hypothetical protein